MPPEPEPPPFRWGDRYDLVGLGIGALVGAVVLLVGASIWLAIALLAATMNVASFALRRRAGVPQLTLWQRSRRAKD
jgi:hypothetical protein